MPNTTSDASSHYDASATLGAHGDDTFAPLASLSTLLWRERELLNDLLFRLDVEHLILSAGHVQWLAAATIDVERATERVYEADALRLVAVQGAAEVLGLDADSSLLAITESAPEPWRSMFAEHREAFLSISDQISTLAATNREAVAAGQRAIRDTLLGLGEQPLEYGASKTADASAVYFDQSM